LQDSLFQILKKSPELANLPQKNEDFINNNPFENYLFENEKSLKRFSESRKGPENLKLLEFTPKKIAHEESTKKNVIEETIETNSENEKIPKTKDEKLENNEKEPIIDTIEKAEKNQNEFLSLKPPLAKNNSLKNLKEMEASLKKNGELERIAKIMKNKEIMKSQKFYDVSSDSDY
jgi:hypothetical protein